MSIPIIDVFRDNSSCISPLSLSLQGRYNLFKSDLEWYIRCIVKNLRILVSIFFISVSDQLIIVKLYVTTRNAKELITSILLRAFNSLLRISFTLKKHSFQSFSLLEECCIHPLQLPPYIYTFPKVQDLERTLWHLE